MIDSKRLFSGDKMREADYTSIVDPSNATDYIGLMVSRGVEYFLLIGPRFGGKTTFLDGVKDDRFPVAKFNQGRIMADLSPSGYMLDNAGRVFGALRKLESTAVEELDSLQGPFLKECRGSTPQSRYIVGVDNSKINLLVFDAPEDILFERGLRTGSIAYETEVSLRSTLKQSRETFVWPTHSEGFKSIHYISLEETTDQFLHETVYARKA